MDIKELEYFIDIAEIRNYQEVAFRQNISQSSLSKAIIRLENELGCQLFDRKTHPISLTPAGECLYSDLKDMMPAYYRMMRHMRSYGAKNIINICSVPKDPFYNLSYEIDRFTELEPKVKVNNRSKEAVTRSEALNMLYAGEIDYLIAHQPLKEDPKIRATFLVDDKLCAVMTPEHYKRLERTGQDGINIRDLGGEKLIETVFGHATVNELSDYYGVTFGDIMSRSGMRRDAVLQFIKYEDRIMICFESDISVFNLTGYKKVYIKGIRQQPFVLMELKDAWHPDYMKTFKEHLLNMKI